MNGKSTEDTLQRARVTGWKPGRQLSAGKCAREQRIIKGINESGTAVIHRLLYRMYKRRFLFMATPHNYVCGSQRIFCTSSAVPKTGNTYSIPTFSEL